MDILRRIISKLDLENIFKETKNWRIPVQLRSPRYICILEEASKTIITLSVIVNNGAFLLSPAVVEEEVEINGGIYHAKRGQAKWWKTLRTAKENYTLKNHCR